MLVAGVVFVVGVVAFSFVHRRWAFPRSGILLLPLLAVVSLRDLVLASSVVLGSVGTYAGIRIGRNRFSGVQRRFGLTALMAIGVVLTLGGALLIAPRIPAIRRWELLLGGGLSVFLGYALFRHPPERRWFDAGLALCGVVALASVGLLSLWVWMTPPSVSQFVLGYSLADVVPRPWLLSASSDAHVVLGTLATVPPADPAATLSVVATAIGSVVFAYLLFSMVGHLLYTAQRGIEKVDDLTVVLVTVATEDVREALMDAIEHNRRLFEDYEFRVLIDEGADLQPELEAMDVELVVVPDDYDPAAVAKGRALQYFVETRVESDEWYAFLDDDNLVQGREFLYEIPRQEAAGNLVMNPTLVPRRGDSVVPFAIDHMRTLFDLTFFRLFTGLLGRPYAGLHGELLCARGDVLLEVGFDRPTIVEDFAFADELVRRGIGTWQSQTTTSILSPHSLDGYFTQRARWFTGKIRWLPRCTPGTTTATGLILGVWMLGIFGGWLAGGLWVLFGPPAQVVYLAPALLSAGLYGSIYAIGVVRAGGRHLPKVLLIPLYATIEHLAPYYSLLRRADSFEVIKK